MLGAASRLGQVVGVQEGCGRGFGMLGVEGGLGAGCGLWEGGWVLGKGSGLGQSVGVQEQVQVWARD